MVNKANYYTGGSRERWEAFVALMKLLGDLNLQAIPRRVWIDNGTAVS